MGHSGSILRVRFDSCSPLFVQAPEEDKGWNKHGRRHCLVGRIPGNKQWLPRTFPACLPRLCRIARTVARFKLPGAPASRSGRCQLSRHAPFDSLTSEKTVYLTSLGVVGAACTVSNRGRHVSWWRASKPSESRFTDMSQETMRYRLSVKAFDETSRKLRT